MEPSDVKAGVEVQLKSGGPKMTVGDKMADGTFRCHWFIGNKSKEAFFNPNVLIPYKKAGLHIAASGSTRKP